eukprot:m.64893 g.64893  ORF g.64893 m.64893 type:complete len:319 (+) comp49753_c0_seq1:30-986(+)
MSGLAAGLQQVFGSTDLYAILQVGRTGSTAEIKRAYRRAALAFHPDKHTHDTEGATQKFQLLGRVCEILTDEEKRKIYDQTGVFDEESDLFQKGDDATWDEYFRTMFAKVDEQLIAEFSLKYKGSDEEIEDLKAAYVECEGDLGDIIDRIMCATVQDDESRIREILSTLIGAKELPSLPRFSKESKGKQAARRARAQKEAQEADKLLAEMKKEALAKSSKAAKAPSGASDLELMILQRQQARQQSSDAFINKLEQKYAQPAASKRPRKPAAQAKSEEAEGEDDDYEDISDDEEAEEVPVKTAAKKGASAKKPPASKRR